MLTDEEVERVITVPFSEALRAERTPFPVLEWKMVGDWQAVVKTVEDERLSQMAAACDCLNLD